MTEHPSDYVPLSDVTRLLGRVLGIHGGDWRIERYERGFEGWAGMLIRTCICDRDKCWCCDPLNLTDEDFALIEAALSGGSGDPDAS